MTSTTSSGTQWQQIEHLPDWQEFWRQRQQFDQWGEFWRESQRQQAGPPLGRQHSPHWQEFWDAIKKLTEAGWERDEILCLVCGWAKAATALATISRESVARTKV